MKDPVVPLEQIFFCLVIHQPDCCGKQLEEVVLGLGWEKVPKRVCMFVHRKQGLCLSVYVDDIKMAGRRQNTAPMLNKLIKLVDLGEPTSFLDHVYWGYTERGRNCH